MILVGLDLGSTTISSVAVDTDTKRVIRELTTHVQSRLTPDVDGGVICDADVIVAAGLEQLEQIMAGLPKVSAIGLTGQMHGIVYTSKNGQAISPLYSWQDQRGFTKTEDGGTYSSRLSDYTGYQMATGYGLTTHYVLHCQNSIPENASSFCTIVDYCAMRLCRNNKPYMHSSMAHSFGLWKLEEARFDSSAMLKVGMNPAFLPQVQSEFQLIGYTKQAIPVAVAIGDNQASFFGSVAQPDTSLLVNVGTSGQISVQVETLPRNCDLELRPLTKNSFIAVGATLCGGKAYQLVADFIADCLRICGQPPPKDLYEKINQAAETLKGNSVYVRPTFSGTRRNPELSGAIEGINRTNFTCASLVRGTAEGIIRELYTMFIPLKSRLSAINTIIVSGNAMRLNSILRDVTRTMFGFSTKVPAHHEEAAFGAALIGGVSSGAIPSLREGQALIRYE